MLFRTRPSISEENTGYPHKLRKNYHFIPEFAEMKTVGEGVGGSSADCRFSVDQKVGTTAPS